MKKATSMIIDMVPITEKYLSDNQNVLLPNDALAQLPEVEQTFLKLAWFFEDPDEQNFNLESLYQTLQNDWLEFALEVIFVFFTEDTYLIENPTHSVITGGDYYMNQSRFAEFLQENGLNYDRSKLSVYIKRGKAPEADITMSGTKYWERLTCERFLEEELKKKGSYDNGVH